jgi:hypothetical protein
VCSRGGVVVALRGRAEALRVLVDAVRVLEKFMRGPESAFESTFRRS